MISVSCSCGRKFKADDHHAGKRTRCPLCGNMLVIGQPPVPPPLGVNDDGELPSWWFPSSSSPRPSMPPAPRQSLPLTGSGSNPDEIQTTVIPAQPGFPSEPFSPSQGKVTPPTQLAQPSLPSLGNAKLGLGMLVAALVICVLGLGAFIRLQVSGNHGPANSPVALSPLHPESNAKPTEDPAQPHTTSQTKSPDQESGNTDFSKPEYAPESPNQPTQPLVASTPKLQLLVPAYFYPAGLGLQAWQHLVEAGSKIKLVVIANPSNGPGDQRNADYFPILQTARDNGIRIVGYVSTRYGDRPLREVRLEIDRWVEFYPQISGFFFDQQSAEVQGVPFYTVTRDYARQKIKDALVINNPGTLCDEAYFAQAVSDVTCIFSYFESFNQLSLPAPLWQYKPSRFAALTYQIPDAKAMRQVINDAINKRIGYLYISDVPKGPNPWAQLPVYWDEEVEAVNRAN
jgi:Spherulation-specific family 4